MRIRSLQDVMKATAIAKQPAEDRGTGDMFRPYWIVVVNPRRQPPMPKFHTGHIKRETAEKVKNDLQLKAIEVAKQESIRKNMRVEPKKFFVLDKPSDDEIERVYGVRRPTPGGHNPQ